MNQQSTKVAIDATVRAINAAQFVKDYGELHKQARRLVRLVNPLTPFSIEAARSRQERKANNGNLNA